MHYAAIKGKSSVINALFMLNKQSGAQLLTRAPIDPNYVEPAFNTTKALKEFNADIGKLNAEIERANLADELPKQRKYSDEFDAGFGDKDEEEDKVQASKVAKGGRINIKTAEMGGEGQAEVVEDDGPAGQDVEKVAQDAEEEPPEATEFG